MSFTVQDLEKLNKIATDNPEIEDLLKQVLEYKDRDPNAALTKLRTYIEKFLAIIYLKELGEVPKKPMIQDMLNKLTNDKSFRHKLPRRVESKFNCIQGITNIAVHGEKVQAEDVSSCLDFLVEIGKWYLESYDLSNDTQPATRSNYSNSTYSQDLANTGKNNPSIIMSHSGSGSNVARDQNTYNNYGYRKQDANAGPATYKQIIHTLILQGNTEEAINQVIDYTESKASSVRNKALLLSGRFQTLRNKQGRGNLSRNEEQLELIQIHNALIDILNEAD